MFTRNGKEYFPMEVEQIISKNGKVIYDRNKRNKPYVYIAVDGTEETEE